MSRRSIVWFIAGFAFMLFVGWVVFPYALYTRTEQPLQFSHATHAGEKVGLACQDCHAIASDGRFAGIPRVGKCAECHSDALTTSPDEIRLVDEYVKKGKEIPWLVYARQPQNVTFPHASHLQRAGLTCERCHGTHGTSASLRAFERNRISGYSRDIWGRSMSGIKTASWDGMKMDDCADCHAERGVANTCLKCHK